MYTTKFMIYRRLSDFIKIIIMICIKRLDVKQVCIITQLFLAVGV